MFFRLLFIWELCAHNNTYWHDSLFPGIHKHVATAVSLLWGNIYLGSALHMITSLISATPFLSQHDAANHMSASQKSAKDIYFITGPAGVSSNHSENHFQQAASLQLPNEALWPISGVGCVELSSSSVPFWPHPFYWRLCLVMLFTLTVIHEPLKLEDIKSAMLQLLWQCFTMFLLILKS